MLKIAAAVVAGCTAGVLALAPAAFNSTEGSGKTERGFTIHTMESTPKASAAYLEGVAEKYGMVPNLAAIMAESPALISSYMTIQDNISSNSTLSPEELNVIQLAVSVENGCSYCVSAHNMVGTMMYKTDAKVMKSINHGEKIENAKLNTLRDFALSVYENQGRVSEPELAAFFDAGYTRANALDVIANIAAKVMSNYTNQLVKTPVDEAFSSFTPSVSLTKISSDTCSTDGDKDTCCVTEKTAEATTDAVECTCAAGTGSCAHCGY